MTEIEQVSSVLAVAIGSAAMTAPESGCRLASSFNPSARGQKAEAFCSRLASLYPNCVVRRTAAQGEARGWQPRPCARVLPPSSPPAATAPPMRSSTASADVPGKASPPSAWASCRWAPSMFSPANWACRAILPARPARLAAGREISIDLGRAEFTVGRNAAHPPFPCNWPAQAGRARRRIGQLGIEEKNRAAGLRLAGFARPFGKPARHHVEGAAPGLRASWCFVGQRAILWRQL
jgi:hypothetical protein